MQTVGTNDPEADPLRERPPTRHMEALLENDPTLIAPLVERVQREFADWDTRDEMACSRVGVALQEALTNALYHGNLEVSSELRRSTRS